MESAPLVYGEEGLRTEEGRERALQDSVVWNEDRIVNVSMPFIY